MQIWLETTDLAVIKKAQQMGVLYGISTTPALIAQSPAPKELLKALLDAQGGPVAVEITGDLIKLGKALTEFSKRIVLKIPVTENGWEAIHILSQSLAPVMATAIFQPTQALLANLAGAHYVAPNFTRILSSGDNPMGQLQTIQKMGLKAKTIAVNPKTVEQIKSCAETGLEGVIVKDDVFRDLTETHELTAQAIEQYDDDWNKIRSTQWF